MRFGTFCSTRCREKKAELIQELFPIHPTYQNPICFNPRPILCKVSWILEPPVSGGGLNHFSNWFVSATHIYIYYISAHAFDAQVPGGTPPPKSPCQNCVFILAQIWIKVCTQGGPISRKTEKLDFLPKKKMLLHMAIQAVLTWQNEPGKYCGSIWTPALEFSVLRNSGFH